MPGSSKNSLPSLQLKLTPSRIGFRVFTILMLLAAVACLFNNLPVWVRAMCLTYVVGLWWFHRRRHSLAESILNLDSHGAWCLGHTASSTQPLYLMPSTRVLGGCVSLVLAGPSSWRRTHLLVFPDMLSQSDFACLRRVLRVYKTELLKAREG